MTVGTMVGGLLLATIGTFAILAASRWVQERPGIFGRTMAVCVMLSLLTLTISVVAGGFGWIPQSIPALMS